MRRCREPRHHQRSRSLCSCWAAHLILRMRIITALILFGLAQMADAQQKDPAVTELTPIVVSSTFQLQLAHPKSDRAVKAVQEAILQKEAKEKAPAALRVRSKFLALHSKVWLAGREGVFRAELIDGCISKF